MATVYGGTWRPPTCAAVELGAVAPCTGRQRSCSRKIIRYKYPHSHHFILLSARFHHYLYVQRSELFYKLLVLDFKTFICKLILRVHLHVPDCQSHDHFNQSDRHNYCSTRKPQKVAAMSFLPAKALNSNGAKRLVDSDQNHQIM